MRKGRLAVGAVGALALGLLALAGLTTPADKPLERAESFASSEAQLFDRQGVLLDSKRLDSTRRRIAWTPLDSISPALVQAVIAAEDQRFYSHGGVDFVALGNAGLGVFKGGLRGASTLSMQTAALLDPALAASSQGGYFGRSPLQKIAQMRAAWALERRYSKTQILENYLNLVSFRGELQGVWSAAHGLYGRAPIALNVEQSALLAALIRAPQARPARVASRACALLKRQGHTDCTALSQLASTLDAPMRVKSAAAAPHVAQRLLRSAGQRLQTSLHAPLQQFAQGLLAEHLRELQGRRVEDGAIVVLENETGQVWAYVGSSGLFSQAAQVDAAQALRQAGSTLKPFLYAQAIDERRLTAASLLDDSKFAVQTADGQYLPRNYANDFKGWVSTRQALASSLNVPAVRTLAMMDIGRFARTLERAGLKTLKEEPDFYGHALALGGADVKLFELTNAYRTLANGGLASEPRFDLGRSPLETSRRAMSAEAAFIVSDMLADNEARYLSFGLDSALRLPFWAPVKTGTSKDMRDNWCLGFSERFTVGVWMGNASGAPMQNVSGVMGAAPIWNALMQYLHERYALKSKPGRPDGLVQAAVQFYGVQESARDELFLKGTESREIRLAEAAFSAPSGTSAANAAHTARGAVGQASITAPLSGAVYAIDPDIPQARQNMVFEQTARARWELNGKPLARQAGAAANLVWTLAPGKHRLRLLDTGGELLDEVRFEVRAPALAARPAQQAALAPAQRPEQALSRPH